MLTFIITVACAISEGVYNICAISRINNCMCFAFFVFSPAVNEFVIGYGLVSNIILKVSFVKVIKDIFIAYVGVA